MECKCGCGESCKKQYVQGHNRRKHLLTKEEIKSMSEAHKGKKHSEEARKKMSESRKGKKHSKETIEKIRKTRSRLIKEGKLFTKETREKMRNNRLGNPLTEKTIQKMRRLYKEGIILSKATREKISKAGMGRIFSEETKRKLKLHRATRIFPVKDSTIEIKIQNFLKSMNVEFFTHQYMKEIEHGYQCDILVPSLNLVIECDGDYWHKYPIGNEIDHIRTKELVEKGFKVLRLWERDIRVMELNDFENSLRDSVN